jgi:hypothetical protein
VRAIFRCARSSADRSQEGSATETLILWHRCAGGVSLTSCWLPLPLHPPPQGCIGLTIPRTESSISNTFTMVCTGRCAAWLCCGIVLRALQERALAEGGPERERERVRGRRRRRRSMRGCSPCSFPFEHPRHWFSLGARGKALRAISVIERASVRRS